MTNLTLTPSPPRPSYVAMVPRVWSVSNAAAVPSLTASLNSM